MNSLISRLITASKDGPPTYETHHWLLPETAEIIYGGLASVLVIGALFKFAGPMIKKSLTARTERIQGDIDNARNTRANAEVEASRIRTALGDINTERSRILAEADTQAAAVLAEGRTRVAAEMADVEAKAMSDIANAAGRVGDELRAEISRLSAVAIERVVASTVNDSVRQDLIENFISKVGASR
jgi:F-type H+-transporting ATPase subunit b